MKRKFPTLFSPIQLGNLVVNNRLFAPPMGHPGLTADGHYTRDAVAYYELRAKGGAGVVCCSEGIVHPSGLSHTRMIQLQEEFVLAGLTEAARAIKKHGAAASIELSHGGKYSDVDQLDKSIQSRNVRYGPSAGFLPSGAEVFEMPKEFIRELIDGFGKGAALVKRAGFDMILLHAGHGWLIHQFYNPAENQRKDEYGGSVQNRTRFFNEVLESIRGAVGPGFPIEVRFSAEDYMEGGNSFEETIEIAKLIQDKIQLLQVSTGSYVGSFDRTHPSQFAPRGANVHYAAAIKQHVDVPVSTLGALNDPAMMEDILASGKADVVEVARGLLADPNLPRKAMTGREGEIRKCIRCFVCLSERVHTQTRICSVNPLIGRELESLSGWPATTPKKVLIAGGGPGGLQAAITAAERGHDVTLYEKSDVLGGALRTERKVSFKLDFFDLARVLEQEARSKGVKIVLGQALTEEIAEREKADVVLVAVGAEPIKPPIPGIDSDKVITGNQISDDDVTIGQNVVIMGGGLVGSEAAVHLAQEGKNVTIVEMLGDIARDVNGLQKPILMKTLAQEGVAIRTGTKGLEVNDEGLKVETPDGTQEVIPADTVIVAVGQRALRGEVEKLLDAAPIVQTIGDCVRPGKVTDALVRGYYAGLDI
ncbi:MAG: FAD-dependent oxidoreductase [Clostridiales Family XIII bacterium]|jgi:2,4-dienoyl-CoA reductase-like NADH-dependent reductase (Old Yellow Enzyme family)/thioredoxin reductase|nr:FAD-dependent oxidoreductase [Clostridiales Family XIII bacterium]